MRLALLGGPHDRATVDAADLPPGYVQGTDDVGVLELAFYVGEQELSRPCGDCGHLGAEHDWTFLGASLGLVDFEPGRCRPCRCAMFRDPAPSSES
jgi:hypothetical protein